MAIALLSAAVALIVTLATASDLSVFPPHVKPRDLSVGTAVAHAQVDRPLTERDRANPTTLDELRDEYQFDALTNRALPIAHALTSAAALDHIADAAAIDPAAISATVQNTTSIPRSLVEPDSERRSSQLIAAERPYRLELQVRPGQPVIDFYAVAPDAAGAGRLAAAAISGGNAFLTSLATETDTTPRRQITLTRLGPPLAGTAGGRSGVVIAALTFVLTFALTAWLLTGFAAAWLRRLGIRPGSPQTRSTEDATEDDGGDWPRTRRPLPWVIAGFLALIWLTPFNGITLNAGLPVDLTLDRLVLPVVGAAWLLALLRGGPGAPRLRMSPVHVAVGAFAAVAALSVVVNAGELSRSLVLELSIKKLGVLASYGAIFVVVASSVRPREVRPFLTYTLVLALVCAVGMLVEYRSQANVFYDVAGALLPGGFDLTPPPVGFDELGRGSVSGPTDHGLEAAAVLSMALPVALVGFIEKRGLGARVAYGLAVCLLGAAAVATFRKSGLLAPLAVGMTLVWLARREALRLAPLAAVVVLVLPFTSFDALGSVTGQLDTSNLDVPTVGDRVSDYNAVRPDFLSHPLLGAGFGSYEHSNNPAENRILDSDLLMRLVEAGVIGLAAFLAMVFAVAFVAGRIARRRDPARAGSALAVAAAAVAFGVLAAFFDEWSFPHAPYVFLTLAGLLAAMMRSDDLAPAASARRAAPTGSTRRTAAPRSAAAAGKKLRRTTA